MAKKKKSVKKSGTPKKRAAAKKGAEESEAPAQPQPEVGVVFDRVVAAFENIVQKSGLPVDIAAQAHARAIARMILLTPLSKEQFIGMIEPHTTIAAQNIIQGQGNAIAELQANKKGGKKK